MANGHFAGFGCVIRNAHGMCMRGCLGSAVENTILRCELLDIWHELVLAWENGCRQVICETDSIEAFSLINNGHASPASDHFDLVSKIIDVLHRRWFVCVTLIQRSANNVANHLVKYAAHLQLSYREWSEPWTELLAQIRQDNALVPF
ncbi:hypothetical protein PIB30_077457 [Stylosanthes scabra]|uniref:RNase H type-1 domain-containing protein n=1 Tax=Stylosanthes scabra TaxID=79078 RepID=A0ABU6SSF9_9FABA|nr:hypothetical protein [Stylosanthes scabra]